MLVIEQTSIQEDHVFQRIPISRTAAIALAAIIAFAAHPCCADDLNPVTFGAPPSHPPVVLVDDHATTARGKWKSPTQKRAAPDRPRWGHFSLFSYTNPASESRNSRIIRYRLFLLCES